ncbi:MAG: hypothetical protein PWQ94_238 [Thermoanaerobacterium sp.]|nr:hypothetical protein [Thermoanaerobacterium sp.]
MKGRCILMNKKGVDITKCLDIFLYTLPYNVLIKPFKTDKNLQKKLAGFRLNEKSSPPTKIVPILRQEILKGNFNYEDFVKEWKMLHGDLYEKICSMESNEIDKQIDELCDVYGNDNVVSALLIDNREDLGDIINKAIKPEAVQKQDSIKRSPQKENGDICKKLKKLEKEVEKLHDKLIKEEKKNIIEVDNLKKALENKEKEIVSLNKKLEDLKQEKKRLELILEHIGLEFDKHIIKLINENVSKDKKNENLKVSLNKTLMDLHQDNQEIKKCFLEVKEILSQLEKKIGIVDVGVLDEQSAVSLEDDDYSLLDDLSKMLKNS